MLNYGRLFHNFGCFPLIFALFQEQITRDMDAREQLAFLSAHIVPVDKNTGEIAEWGSLILENEKMNGCQRIRCFPPGIFSKNLKRPSESEREPEMLNATGFHGRHVQDCIFAIPGPDSDSGVTYDEFDFKDHRCKKAVLYGRVYAIFKIGIKFRQKRRRNDPRGSEIDFLLKEDCVFLKEFIKCAPAYSQPGFGAATAQAAAASANALAKAGCVKLREAPHGGSIWRVLPVRHVLGRVPIAPLTHQKSKKPKWRPQDDVTEERMWWTINWTMNWGRDKSYKICESETASLSHRQAAGADSELGDDPAQPARRGPGRPSRSSRRLRAAASAAAAVGRR
jgi:hypothetical protein